MNCPLCHAETKVIDSRSVFDDAVIRRRRECLKCHFRFSTHEEMELLDLQVEKKDGSVEPYKREKLEDGIRKALEKRPFEEEEIRRLIRAIEVAIQSKTTDIVSSQKIGQIIIRKLKKFDEVAYIRFASVYKDFASIDDFRERIDQIVKPKTKKVKAKARS